MNKDLLDTIANVNLVSSSDRTTWNNKADINDIPTKTSDLTNDSGFLTSHQDVSGKENISNKVTTISSTSTNNQYPSALCMYEYIDDKIGNIETLLAALR